MLHRDLIISGIIHLLRKNGFLVLPGMGGFVMKKVPAHIGIGGGVIYPPSMQLSFNRLLQQDDGSLSLWVKEKLRCTHEQATGHVQNFSEYCLALLKNKGRISLEGIGFFHLDSEGKIQFEAEEYVNFLPSSFGLAPVSISELVPVQDEKRIAEFDDRIITQTNEKGKERIRRYRRIAVASLLFALLFSGLLTVLSNQRFSGRIRAALGSTEHKGTYTPVHYSELKLHDLKGGIKDYAADINGIASIELETGKSVLVKAFDVEESTSVKKGRISVPRRGNFEVVLGCFSIASNADKLIRRLSQKGVEAFVSGKNEKGLLVVSGGGYGDKGDAAERLTAVKDACPNAWIRKVQD